MKKAVVLCWAALAPLYAVDHANLDEMRPLRLEDAYPIASGEWAIEAGAGLSVQRRGPDRAVFPIEILYGPAPNFHLSLGTTLSSDPLSIDESGKSGDLELSGLYNFNQETIWIPAFAVKAEVEFPSGVGSQGVDAELQGIVTRSFGILSLHFNAAYEFVGDPPERGRNGRYEFVLGASLPVGAPMNTRLTAVVDVFTEQSVRRGDPNIWGVELGARYQLGSQVVIDAGIGSEFSGPRDRSEFTFTAGASASF